VQTQTIYRTAVEQLPAVEQQVSFITGHGNEQATYTDALLWTLLERTKAPSSEARAPTPHDSRDRA
jgi:hypothetical protein